MSAIRTMKMGPGILELGETGAIANLARRCTNAILTPNVDSGENRHFLSGDEEAGDRTETWTLGGTLAQDYGQTDAIWEFLFNHRGQVMPFRFQPDTTAGHPISGQCIVEAVALGGDVNTKPTSDFEFALVGVPVLETVAQGEWHVHETNLEACNEAHTISVADYDPAPVVSSVQLDDPAYIQAA